MKKHRKLIAILVAVEMLFATAVCGAYATDEVTEPQLDEQIAEQLEEPIVEAPIDEELFEEAITEEETVPEEETAEMENLEGEFTDVVVEDVAAFSSYKSVLVLWSPNPEATGYRVYYKPSTDEEYTEYRTVEADPEKTTMEKRIGTDFGVLYNFKVVALNGETESSLDLAKEVRASRVRTVYYKLTLGETIKLTSHDKKKLNHTFKNGSHITADGFGQGSYKFEYKGHSFEIKWFRIKTAKGQIKTNAYNTAIQQHYNDEYKYVTATSYVNAGEYRCKKPYLIWISLYSQRVYIFKGTKVKEPTKKDKAIYGNWRVIRSWQCGSGKAKTPTPSGMNKELWKKCTHYSKHKYWNCFSGMNAIHGSNKGDAKLGKLISNGCVRVTNNQAKWVMNNIPIGTRVLVF